MIEQIRIQNFKSIEDLTLNLGRINIFIGENGCGKSNILEAICMASAASNEKLDNEFLASRGIRLTSAEFTRSAFEKEKISKPILFDILMDSSHKNITVNNDNKPYSKWSAQISIPDYIKESLRKYLKENGDNTLERILNFLIAVEKMTEEENSNSFSQFAKYLKETQDFNKKFNNFIIYSPENTALRTFDKEGQVEPLGVSGEGLFKLLKVLSSEEKLSEIKEKLVCMGWFEDFLIKEETTKKEIHIKDRYIDNDLGYFTQNSTNEGFLFILFYLCLFVSKDTPNFFAVDNIDASLNPKLCSELTEILVKLAKKYNKQAIFTTHNASVLDGLNLHDDDQRLFVVSRNRSGRTKIKRVHKPKLNNNEDPVKLSVAFTRGYIGGLSRGF